jgi:nicotinamidase-related amidase
MRWRERWVRRSSTSCSLDLMTSCSTSASAFTETDLDNSLRAHHVGRLVLVCQHTACCIRHMSYDAFAKGHELVVCSDATTVFESRTDEPIGIRQREVSLDELGFFA